MRQLEKRAHLLGCLAVQDSGAGPGRMIQCNLGFIISIQKICVMCMNVDEIIGSSILDILSNFLQLEGHYFRFIAYRSGYTGKVNTDIVEESVKH